MSTSNTGAAKRSGPEERSEEKIVEIYEIVSELHKQLGTGLAPDLPIRAYDGGGTFLGYQPYSAGVLGSSPLYSTSTAIPGAPACDVLPAVTYGYPYVAAPVSRFVGF